MDAQGVVMCGKAQMRLKNMEEAAVSIAGISQPDHVLLARCMWLRGHIQKKLQVYIFFMLLDMYIGMRQDICGLSGHSCFIRQQAKKSGGCFGLGFPSEIPEIPKTEKTHGSPRVSGFKMEPVLDCAGPVLSKKLKTPLVFEGLWLQDLEQDPKKVPRAPPPLEF